MQKNPSRSATIHQGEGLPPEGQFSSQHPGRVETKTGRRVRARTPLAKQGRSTKPHAAGMSCSQAEAGRLQRILEEVHSCWPPYHRSPTHVKHEGRRAEEPAKI